MSLDMRPGMTIEGDLQPPTPINEPVWGYEPGSPERADLKRKLDQMASEVVEIPIIIGGKDYTTGNMGEVVVEQIIESPIRSPRL